VYDGTESVDVLYRGGAAVAQSSVSANEYMVVAGHNWTLSLSTQKAFEDRYGRGSETLVAIAGTGLMLALLTWLMLNGRDRALRLAAAMTDELRHIAQHDLLTDLPNRALFGDRLNQELARAKRQNGRFALVFIDLDHFKPINDNFRLPDPVGKSIGTWSGFFDLVAEPSRLCSKFKRRDAASTTSAMPDSNNSVSCLVRIRKSELGTRRG